MVTGKKYIIKGKEVELFTIGALCDLLDRQRQTIRKWERDGIIPPAQYRSKTGRRLYTLAQMEAVAKIVEQFDIKQGVAIPTEFREELAKAFKEASNN